MLSEKLRANFNCRITAERHVLKFINESIIAKRDLAGLTSYAISDWEKQFDAISKISALLYKISLRLRLENNISNELFLGEEFDNIETYEVMFLSLQQIVKEQVSGAG